MAKGVAVLAVMGGWTLFSVVVTTAMAWTNANRWVDPVLTINFCQSCSAPCTQCNIYSFDDPALI